MFYKYILEIRNRVFLLVFCWIFSAFISYLYKETLLFLLIKPNFFLDNSTPIYFIFTNITELLHTYLTLLYFVSNQIFCVSIIYHTVSFLVPGLFFYEYQVIKKVLCFIIIFFLLSIFLLNSTILPTCWNFFLSFQEAIQINTINFYLEAKINEYVNFYINLYYICNLSCQMFIFIIFFLIYIKGNISLIKKFRKSLYLIFVIFATLITPPDITTQLILSVIVISVYEVLIFFILLKSSFNLEAS